MAIHSLEPARMWTKKKARVASAWAGKRVEEVGVLAEKGGDKIGWFFEGLRMLAAPAFIGLSSAFVLGFPEQVLELYRAMAENLVSGRALGWALLPWIYLLLSTPILCLGCFYVGRLLIFLHIEEYALERSLRKHVLSIALVAVSVAPLVGLMYGMCRALPLVDLDPLPPNVILWLVGTNSAAWTLFIVTLAVKFQDKLPEGIAIQKGLKQANGPVVASLVLFVICAMLAFTNFPEIVGKVGTVSIFVTFEIYLLLALFLLIDYGWRKSMPVVSTIVVLAFVFGAMELNDNHRVRTEVAPNDAVRIGFDEAFEGWLRSRQDLELYEQYPVFIVASEGGGIRAAYFSALVMSQLQDLCPAFAQHVFAISGVSGGSVGGSLFSVLARANARNESRPRCDLSSPAGTQNNVALSREILGRDHLSPLVAGSLGPDFLARFLPWKWEGADRARFLEESLDNAVREASRGRFTFSGPLLDMNRDFTKGAYPALFLNTTHVETGRRFVFSNIARGVDGLKSVDLLSERDPALDIRVATAAVLSARFPYVTPVGFIDLPWSAGREHVKHRFADGGYFDNTGVATAYDILSGMLSVATKKDLPSFIPVVIYISNEPARPQGAPEPTPGWTDRGLEEVLSPIRTMINARTARRDQPINLLKTSMYVIEAEGVPTQTARKNPVKAGFIDFGLNERKLPLPLGWVLSPQAQDLIWDQVERPRSTDDCARIKAGQAKERYHNGCSSGEVIAFLKPRQFKQPPTLVEVAAGASQPVLHPALQSVPVISEIYATRARETAANKAAAK